MSSVGWVVDAVAFDTYHDELVSAIERQGHRAVSVVRPNPPYQWKDTNYAYRRAFPAGSCVITHGDVSLVKCVLRDRLWTPGAFASIKRFFCSHYYAHFGHYLLNRDYIMLPYAELPRCREFLFDSLGRDGVLFARPDSPLKLFRHDDHKCDL